MKTFTDTVGRTWTITIHVAAIKKLRGTLDVDLFRLADDGFRGLAEIVGDPVKLVDVLYVLCAEQAQSLNITDEQFGAAMGGDVLLTAADAFVEELIGFFPDARVRATLSKVIDKGRQVRDLVMTRAEAEIDRVTPNQVAEDVIGNFRGLSPSSTNSPASSASTPTPGP